MMRDEAMDDRAQVTEDARGPVRGAVVLAHGLNTTPEVMSGLAAVLRRDGYACDDVTLHPGDVGRQHPDDVAAGWCRAFDEVHDHLAAHHPGVPVSAVGFSLGGLLALLRASRQDSPLDRLVLWAPPLALTRRADAVRLLTPAHRAGLGLLSAAPSESRARRATPLAEYAALLRLVEDAAMLPRSRLTGTSALVLLGSRDPLVSLSGVTRWVTGRRLAGWRVERLHVDAAPTPGHRHLVVSEAVLGAQEWGRASRLMLDHLGAAVQDGDD